MIDFIHKLSLPEKPIALSHRQIMLELSSLESMYPNQLKLTLGPKSKGGRQFLFVEVGDADATIAVTAGAHSDEPVGTLTCLYLIKNLLENPTFQALLNRYKFVFHPMLDPDGAELNLEWSARNFDYRSYLLHEARNYIPEDDCEHGIPINSKQYVRPELQFFMRNIDLYKGKITSYITLHTTHRTGGSVFLTAGYVPPDNFLAQMSALCESYGVPVMDIDVHGRDGIEYIAPGFLKAPAMIELAEKFSDQPDMTEQLKMSTYEYVQKFCHAQAALISELPSVVDQNLCNVSETTVSMQEVTNSEIEQDKIHYSALSNAINELQQMAINKNSFWLKQSRFIAKHGPKTLAAKLARSVSYEGIMAKQYEVDEVAVHSILNKLKIHKLWIKALAPSEYKTLLDEHTIQFNMLLDNLLSCISLTEVPVTTQIRVQTAMILANCSLHLGTDHG